jgi:hypothetical protein
LLQSFSALSARETYRTFLKDLGNPYAVPVDKADYEKIRAQALAKAAVSQ